MCSFCLPILGILMYFLFLLSFIFIIWTRGLPMLLMPFESILINLWLYLFLAIVSSIYVPLISCCLLLSSFYSQSLIPGKSTAPIILERYLVGAAWLVHLPLTGLPNLKQHWPVSCDRRLWINGKGKMNANLSK